MSKSPVVTGSFFLPSYSAKKIECPKAKEKANLTFTNNIELNVYLRYEDESLVQILNFTHIHERYYSGSYKFVIGKINLQNLIDNQQLIENNKAFVAFADQLAGVNLAVEAKQAAEVF